MSESVKTRRKDNIVQEDYVAGKEKCQGVEPGNTNMQGTSERKKKRVNSMTEAKWKKRKKKSQMGKRKGRLLESEKP